MFASHETNFALYTANPNAFHNDEYEVEANRWYEYSVYTNFSDTDYLPHEWSFVVWSDVEPVTILINDVLSVQGNVVTPFEQTAETNFIEDGSFNVQLLSVFLILLSLLF